MARATRSKKDVCYVCGGRTKRKRNGDCERANEWRINGEETEQGVGRTGHGGGG